MGVDPGLRKTGWGVIRAGTGVTDTSVGGGRRRAVPCYVDSGLIMTDAKQNHIERLRVIGAGLTAVVKKNKPDVIGIERVFINKSLKNSLELGEARGVAVMALLSAGKPIIELSALQIKQSVTGAGRAGKKRVSLMVAHLLAHTAPAALPEDCSDALACALAAVRVYENPMPINRRAVSRRSGRSMRQFAAGYVTR